MADPRLLDRYRLIAFDLRGHGQNSAPLSAEKFDVTGDGAGQRLWALDLDAVLQGLEGPHVVAWSFGCTVAQAWIREHEGLGDIASFTPAGGLPVLGPADPLEPTASLIALEAISVLAAASTSGERAYAERVLRRGEGETIIPSDLLEHVATIAAGTRPEAARAALGFTFDNRSLLRALPDRDRQRVQAMVCELDGIFDHAAMRTSWDKAWVETRTITAEVHSSPLRAPARNGDFMRERLVQAQR